MIPILFPGDHTAVLHTICDPVTGDALYPDLLYAHPFREEALVDALAYAKAMELTNSQTLSGYVFMLVADEDLPKVTEWLQSLPDKAPTAPCYDTNAKDLQLSIAQFANDLRLSVSLQRSFHQLMEYYLSIGGDPNDLLSPFYQEYDLPVKNKKEGIQLYERIRNLILG